MATTITPEQVKETAQQHGIDSAPRPLIPETGAPARYPIEALPPLMRDAAQAIAQHVQAPLALAGQCVIGAAAHLAQTRVNAPDLHGEDGMPASVFMLTLGESGDRKSACSRLAFKEIDHAEKQARQQHKAQCDAIQSEAAGMKGKGREEYLTANPLPADPGAQYTDATIERIVGDFIHGKPAATWNTDEGGQVLGGSTFTSDTRVAAVGTLCKLFDRGNAERMRARGNLEGSGFAYNRRLSIHLMAQPVAVAEALADPLLKGQGFLARFLFASPESIAGTRFLDQISLSGKSYSDSRLQRYWARCRDIMVAPEHIDPQTSEVKPFVLHLDALAEQVWIEFYNEIEGQQTAVGAYAGIRPFAGRAGELARRVAAVLACFEGAASVDTSCMHSACALVRYSLAEWLRYSDGSVQCPKLQKAAALMDWLREPRRADDWRQFHVNRLGKSGPPLVRSAKVRDSLLAVLVEYRHLTPIGNKQYQVSPCADSAEIAGSRAAAGAGFADDLRKSAEIEPAPSASAENPQPSATLPQMEAQDSREVPQNPQNPQAAHATTQKWEEIE